MYERCPGRSGDIAPRGTASVVAWPSWEARQGAKRVSLVDERSHATGRTAPAWATLRLRTGVGRWCEDACHRLAWPSRHSSNAK
jgi:hypothetical protein